MATPEYHIFKYYIGMSLTILRDQLIILWLDIMHLCNMFTGIYEVIVNTIIVGHIDQYRASLKKKPVEILDKHLAWLNAFIAMVVIIEVSKILISTYRKVSVQKGGTVPSKRIKVEPTKSEQGGAYLTTEKKVST